MIQYERIDDSKEIDLDKTDKSKECEVCHDNYFNNGFKSDSKVCNSCNCGIESFGNFAIMTVNDVGYRVFMFDMTEKDVHYILEDFESRGLQKCCSMKKLMLQKKVFLINQANQKNICFFIIGILKILVINMYLLLVIDVMMY